MPTIQSTAKFRPVLTADEITHILRLAKRDGTKDSMNLIATLARIEFQILNGAMTPAYVTEPKVSMVEDLGFDEPAATPSAHVSDTDMNIEVLYSLWAQRPESLTAMQIAEVRSYRYKNGKMTVDEEKVFEKEVLGLDI